MPRNILVSELYRFYQISGILDRSALIHNYKLKGGKENGYDGQNDGQDDR